MVAKFNGPISALQTAMESNYFKLKYDEYAFFFRSESLRCLMFSQIWLRLDDLTICWIHNFGCNLSVCFNLIEIYKVNNQKRLNLSSIEKCMSTLLEHMRGWCMRFRHPTPSLWFTVSNMNCNESPSCELLKSAPLRH